MQEAPKNKPNRVKRLIIECRFVALNKFTTITKHKIFF